MSDDIQCEHRIDVTNPILAMMVALDGFFEGSSQNRQGLDEGLNQDANDLLLAQGLLALILLFAGGVKLVLPVDVLTAHLPLPGLLVRFIGVVETVGAIFLARRLRIRPA